jgi:hypothetical protein
MRRKSGRNGPFLSCIRYPDCSGTAKAFIGIACPRPLCTGTLLERLNQSAQWGEQMMVSCSQYPECKYVEWRRVEARPCFWCALPFTYMDETAGVRECIDPGCRSHDTGSARTLDHVERALNAAGTMQHAAQLLATAAGFAASVSGMTNEELLKYVDLGRQQVSPPRDADGGAQ